MRRLSVMTVLTVVGVMQADQVSAQMPPARLTVEVRNHTAHGASVAGDEATLRLHQGPRQIDSRSATVGEDGTAVFEGLPTGPGLVAVAHVKHQNMVFRSRPVSLDSAGAELSASVQVYDVSKDPSKLSIGMHHLMVALRGTSLECTEFMELTNASDRAVTGKERDGQDRPVVLRVMLPQGFHDLNASGYLEREALVVTEDGFYDTMAVPPGDHQITFAYKVDVGRDATQITKGITLPTSNLMVFWERGQGALEGLGTPGGQLVNADGVPLDYYRRTGLKPGDTLAFRITGLNPRNSDVWTWIVLAVVFAAILAVALLRRRPKATPSRR